MSQIFVVYKTDTWHSYASRNIIGICTTKANVMRVIKQKVKKEGAKLGTYQLFNLQNYKQTQGYAGDGEFQYELFDKNVLL